MEVSGVFMKNQAIIELAVEELADEFQENPDEFFNEHDFHHKFFCILYPEFNNLVHPEYPTRKRFIKERTPDEEYAYGTHCFEPIVKKGVRGHYDFVIFKEKFYSKHKDSLDKFDRLSNKDVNTNIDIEDQYIDFVFEFKYITGGSKNIIREIEFDLFKLNQAEEVENKYLIVFIRKVFSDKGFKQIIEPLNKLKKEQKEIEMLVFSK